MKIFKPLLLGCLFVSLLCDVSFAASEPERTDKERIAAVAEKTVVEVQRRVKAANKMGYDEREVALDALMHEVVSPLIHNSSTVGEFFGEYWAEIQRLGLEAKAREAVLLSLKDNYMFVIERSDRAKVEFLRVVIRSETDASAYFRINLRKRIPVEIELRPNEKHEWRIHDLVLMRRSIRDEVREKLHKDMLADGPQVAIENILADK